MPPPHPRRRRVPPRLTNLARYASVSAVATTVTLTTLAVLVGAGHWPAAWANVVATALGTVPSFELNRRWVWRRKGPRSVAREVAPFVVLCLVELAVSSEAVGVTSRWTLHAGWSPDIRTVADLAANVATYGALWLAQYAVLDRVLFARHGADPAIRRAHRVRDGAIQPPLCPSSAPAQEATSGSPR